jgi:plasmid stabilization system protein ParE
MKVRLHPEARAELREARRWYYERSPLSATAFAHVIEHAVSQIAKGPTLYPLADHGTRKLVLQRFPFNIFYRPDEGEVVIVAVAHQKRRPGYWSRRLTP